MSFAISWPLRLEVCKTMCLRDEINKQGQKFLDWIKYVELGGAIVVMFAIGLFLGEIGQDKLHHTSKMLGYAASVGVVICSIATVYFIQYDDRRSKVLSTLFILACVCATTLGHTFSLFSHEVRDILISITGLAVCIYMLGIAIAGSRYCQRRKLQAHRDRLAASKQGSKTDEETGSQ